MSAVTNQQWINVKSPKEITLEGVNVEIDWTDSTVNSIIVRDAKGNALRIVKGDYSGMKAMIPAPPPTVTKYRVTGDVAGIPFEKTFDDEDDAIQSRCALLAADSSVKNVSTVEKVKVLA